MTQTMGGCVQEVSGSALPAQTGGRFVDLHCHCLPSLDDGPESIRESLMLCRALADDGVDTVVATPHQLGRFDTGTEAQKIRRLVECLNRELLDHGIDLTVLPGAEIRVDERIDDLLAGGELLTLADRGRHILLELPADVFIDIGPLMVQLRTRGVEIILAHPERSVPLLGQPQALQRWLDCGVTLQVTAASLIGRFGPEAARAAWRLVAEGAAGIVATDTHDPGAGGPCMMAAFRMISASCGPEWARRLCIENPARVLRGQGLPPAFWHEPWGSG